MNTLFRASIVLLVAIWLGALAFFPFLAQIAFRVEPNRQTAGLIVGASLVTLHKLGLTCGALLFALLTLGKFRRPVYPAFGLLIVMLAITAVSQFVVIPLMEADRIAVGGSISLAPPGDPHRVAFERLHRASVPMEATVLFSGILLVVALAWVDSGRGLAEQSHPVRQ